MKIVPSGLIDTITQSSGGTTIQNSYGGLQLHKKAYQKKKKSNNQQKCRAAFTNVQSSWSALDSEEQGTWIAAAAPGQSGFELYSSTNNILVNQGIAIIPEYVTPVLPIVNDVIEGGGAYNFVTHPFYYNQNIESPLELLPTSGWIPYIKWSGWILESQYRFPEAKLIVPINVMDPINAERIFFEIQEKDSNTFANMKAGSKAQFIIAILNTTTGQIQELLNYQNTVT